MRDQCLLRDGQNVNVLVLGSGPPCLRESLLDVLAPLEATTLPGHRHVVINFCTVDVCPYGEDHGHVTSSSTKITGEVTHLVCDYSDPGLMGMIGREKYVAVSLVNGELGDDMVVGTADNINDAAADCASLVCGSSNPRHLPPLRRLWCRLVSEHGWSLTELCLRGFGEDAGGTVPFHGIPKGEWGIAKLVNQSPDSLAIEARIDHKQNLELLLASMSQGKQRILDVDPRKITFYGLVSSDRVADAAKAGTVEGEERVDEDVLAVETLRCEAARAGAEQIAASGGVNDDLAAIAVGVVGGASSSKDSVGVHRPPGSEIQPDEKLFYFGKSRNPEEREATHRRDMQDGSHPNPCLRGAAVAAGLLEEKMDFRVFLEVVFPAGTPVRFSATQSHGEACLRVDRNCADQHPPSSPLPFAALRLLPYW